mmetsp:Transcript_31192/g.75021  ORF Transcript_31192/g.75021 Transcript_31192/m.75021 type:complete len:219 (-) Transcript_31192:3139-3795(-)
MEKSVSVMVLETFSTIPCELDCTTTRKTIIITNQLQVLPLTAMVIHPPFHKILVKPFLLEMVVVAEALSRQVLQPIIGTRKILRNVPIIGTTQPCDRLIGTTIQLPRRPIIIGTLEVQLQITTQLPGPLMTGAGFLLLDFRLLPTTTLPRLQHLPQPLNTFMDLKALPTPKTHNRSRNFPTAPTNGASRLPDMRVFHMSFEAETIFGRFMSLVTGIWN